MPPSRLVTGTAIPPSGVPRTTGPSVSRARALDTFLAIVAAVGIRLPDPSTTLTVVPITDLATFRLILTQPALRTFRILMAPAAPLRRRAAVLVPLFLAAVLPRPPSVTSRKLTNAAPRCDAALLLRPTNPLPIIASPCNVLGVLVDGVPVPALIDAGAQV